MQMVSREGLARKELRRLNDCGCETHFYTTSLSAQRRKKTMKGLTRTNMPLNMAMEQKDTRVIGFEAEHGVRVGIDLDDVSTRWLGGESAGAAGVVACSTFRTAHDLELVAVKVEGVDGIVLVVDDNVYDGVVTHDEGVDVAVDDGIGVGVPCGGGGVQSRHFLGDVGLAIDTCSGNGVNEGCCIGERDDGKLAYLGMLLASVQKAKLMVSVWVTGPYAAPPSYGVSLASSCGLKELTTSVVKALVLSITSWPVKLLGYAGDASLAKSRLMSRATRNG